MSLCGYFATDHQLSKSTPLILVCAVNGINTVSMTDALPGLVY